MTIKRLVLLFLLSALLTIAIQIGCDTLVTESNTVIEAGHPIADFTLESPDPAVCCAPCTVVFSDRSDGPRHIYIWAFGDGDSLWDTLPGDPNAYESPTHVYDSPGIYAVSLRIIDTVLNTWSVEMLPPFIYVGASTAGFEADTTRICPGDAITFRPDQQSEHIEYNWDFGDGSTPSNMIVPTHVFDDTGTFTVVLEATDTCGTAYDSLDIFVGQCPSVSFAADVTTGCEPLLVTFEDRTEDYGKVVVNRIWRFGDGTSSSEIAPQHEYTFPSTFTVSLTVTTEDGTSGDTAVDLITVFDTTLAAFGVDGATSFCWSPTRQVQTNFVDSSVGAPDSLLWHFGDGFTDTARNPIHFYTAPGIYSCTLEAYGPCGADTLARDSFITVADILLETNVDFSIDTTSGTGAVGSEFTFTDLTTVGIITERTWYIGTTSVANGVITHTETIDSAATYDIRLVLGNECGTVVKVITLDVPAL